MKKQILLRVSFALAFFCAILSHAAGAAPIEDGVYTASAWGNSDEILVETSIEEGKIVSVKILDEHETNGISDYPLEVMPERIIDAQSVGIDVVSGASMTSRGIINAVSDCLSQADADIDEWKKAPQKELEAPQDASCDVVVIGSGAAGMNAAIHAANEGATVILVEKQEILGGTSLLSESMFGSVGTYVHEKEGIDKTAEDLLENYLKPEAATGGCLADPDAARILAENSSIQANYLIDLGVDFDHTAYWSKFVLSPAEGKRVGEMVIPALTKEMEKAGVDIRNKTRAVKLLLEDNSAKGIEVETEGGSYTISAPAIVIATGGYAANRDMVKEYLPQWADSIYYCSPGDTGDGERMAMDAGLEVIDMTIMKANPLVFYDHTHALTMDDAVDNGAIMVNHEGKRFANEEGSYGIAPLINSQTDGEGIIIFDDTLLAQVPSLAQFDERGYLTKASSLEELAALCDIDPDALLESVENYMPMVEAQEDTEFGRWTLVDCLHGTTFYARVIKPSIQGTFGGIHTNTKAEVYTKGGEIAEGVYAAGECAQEGINGLNPMTSNMVFGEIAGENAAKYALGK